MNLEIANRLVELRKKSGLSQEQLADKLGLSRQAVSKWERAEASPDTDNLILLAKLYGISLDELLKTDAKEEEIRQETIDREEEKKECKKELTPRDKKYMMIERIIFISFLLGGLATYLLVSSLLKESIYWSSLWVLILAGPIFSSIVNALWHKKITNFLYPLLMVVIYILLGFYLNLWHPAWVVFITIPIFYVIASIIDKRKGHYKEDEEEK